MGRAALGSSDQGVRFCVQIWLGSCSVPGAEGYIQRGKTKTSSWRTTVADSPPGKELRRVTVL